MIVRRIALWTILAALVAAGVAYAFWPRPIPVDLIAVTNGPFVVSIEEEGETRVRDVFKLSAPVTGRNQRIELNVGDFVEAEKTIVTRIEPIDPSILDVRSQIQAAAEVQAAEAARAYAAAELESAKVNLEFAKAELERAQRLSKINTVSIRTLELADRNYRTQLAAVKVAESAFKMREYDLARAQAQLISPQEASSQREERNALPILSPVSGRVLRIFDESEGVIQAGSPLVEIGDPRDLEIEVDLLSSDAVRVSEGQRVEITGWGGDSLLHGKVIRTEPFGFKKVSALGIEEQRVNVIVSLTSPAEEWQRLGHGYQLDIRIVIWEDAVLQVPLTALFRKDGRWAVFVARDGVAELRFVELGQRNALHAEIRGNLEEGELIVSHPGNRIEDGVAVEQRVAL